MKSQVIYAVLFGSLTLAIAGAQPELPDRIVAETGPPTVDATPFTPIALYTRAEYDSESLGYPLAVAPERDPAIGDDSARYGFVGWEAKTMVTFVVRSDGSGGRVVIADQDRDGDLEDESSHPFEQTDRGMEARFDLEGPRAPQGLLFLTSPPTWARDRVFLMMLSRREGVIALGDSAVRFAVRGTLGEYGRDYDEVLIDVDGDGVLNPERASHELFVPPRDTHVNLAGRTWGFEVSRDGSRLTLTALAWDVPERPALGVGKPAPDFEYVDVLGHTGRLSDHRGRWVLLYFWATWCGPCREQTPHVLEAYSKFHEIGLDVLGIAKNDEVSSVLAYVGEQGIPWPQIVEDSHGPIVDLYRVSGVPLTVLVGRDGTIVDQSMRSEQIVKQIEDLANAESPALRDECW